MHLAEVAELSVESSRLISRDAAPQTYDAVILATPWRQSAQLLKTLPALRRPTVSNLSQDGWIAVETVIDEHVVRELIPELKAAGAEGIIEYPLNKVVY